MQNTDNKRRHTRLVHHAKIQLSSKSETITISTNDISESGLFVQGSFRNTPAIGDILEVLVLDIENGIPRPAIVRRIEPGKGIGVEFI